MHQSENMHACTRLGGQRSAHLSGGTALDHTIGDVHDALEIFARGLRVVRQLVPAQHKPALFPGFEATLRKKTDELRCEGQAAGGTLKQRYRYWEGVANLAAALLDEPAVDSG